MYEKNMRFVEWVEDDVLHSEVYIITDHVQVGNKVFVMAESKDSPCQFASWQSFSDEESRYDNELYSNKKSEMTDYFCDEIRREINRTKYSRTHYSENNAPKRDDNFINGEQILNGKYEIIQSFRIGNCEFFCGVGNIKSEFDYVVADYKKAGDCWTFENIRTDDDYLSIITEYTNRVQTEIEKVKNECNEITVPLTYNQCFHHNPKDNIIGKVVAIEPLSLADKCRRADRQLIYVTGGFGSQPNLTDFSVTANYLYSGERVIVSRNNIQGVVNPVFMPAWAKNKLLEIKRQEEITENRDEER